MRPIAIAALASLTLAAACSTNTSITRERTTLTPTQIAEMGLECRKETGIGTTIARSICASPEAWKQYEEDGTEDSRRVFDEIGLAPNDRFNNQLGTN